MIEKSLVKTDDLVKAEDLLFVFSQIYKDDTRFLMIKTLSLRDGVCLRELARNVGRSPKSLKKHLKELNEKGVIKGFKASPNIKIYRLSERMKFLRILFKECFHKREEGIAKLREKALFQV